MEKLIAFCGAFAFMEFVAWFMHRFVMHGFLWVLHEDHHVRKEGFFEKNDLFFLLFATPSIILIFLGAAHGYDWRFWLGFGIAAYGFTYSFMHDIVIHQRWKWLTSWRNPYIQAARRAHASHHRVRTKEGCVSFGMLVFHPKHLRNSLSQKQRPMTSGDSAR